MAGGDPGTLQGAGLAGRVAAREAEGASQALPSPQLEAPELGDHTPSPPQNTHLTGRMWRLWAIPQPVRGRSLSPDFKSALWSVCVLLLSTSTKPYSLGLVPQHLPQSPSEPPSRLPNREKVCIPSHPPRRRRHRRHRHSTFQTQGRPNGEA